MKEFDIKETFNQMGGFHKIRAMIGLHSLVSDSKENSYSFKFKGCKKYNYLKIQLDLMDTYVFTFGRIVKHELKNKLEIHGLYCDMIKSTFKVTTGLYLSL